MLKLIIASTLLILSSYCAFESPILKSQSATSRFLPNLTLVDLPKIVVSDSKPLEVTLNITLPTGFHLNNKAPSRLWLKHGDDKELERNITDLSNKVELTQISSNDATINLEATVYFCNQSPSGLCQIQSFSFTQPITKSKTDLATINFTATCQAKQVESAP